MLCYVRQKADEEDEGQVCGQYTRVQTKGITKMACVLHSSSKRNASVVCKVIKQSSDHLFLVPHLSSKKGGSFFLQERLWYNYMFWCWETFLIMQQVSLTTGKMKLFFSLFLLCPAAICLLKKLLEPDPSKRPNIHQVMADSWLQLANKNTGAPYLNRYTFENILVCVIQEKGV